jgi:hypothetical protein
VSHPSHPVPPVQPEGSSSPSTSEIPVVRPAGTATRSLPPHPGATSASAGRPVSPEGGPQATGPVDFVPGLPGLGTAPPPPPTAPQPAPAAAPVWPETLESDTPTSGSQAERAPRDRRAFARLGLTALALVLLQLGLAPDFGSDSLWAAVTLWSAFATLAVVAALLAFAVAAAPGGRLGEESAWRIGAVGLLGLATFWLLVALPGADSDRGFLLTAAVACTGGALWVGTDRKG